MVRKVQRDLAWALCTTGLIAGPAQAQFSDDFDSGTSGSLYNIVSDFEIGIPDNNIDFGFNYGTVGIPSAPHSTGGTTTGLLVQSNVTNDCGGDGTVNTPGASCDGSGNEGEQITFIPKQGADFGPNDSYILQFDFYAFVEGVQDITAMTETVSMGLNADGQVAPWTFSGQQPAGTWFEMTLDGDSSSDIRAFEGNPNPGPGTPGGDDLTRAREIEEDDNTDPLLQSVEGFGVPGNPNGALAAANPIFFQGISAGWATFQLEKDGNTVTWRVNGNPEEDDIFEDLVTFQLDAEIEESPQEQFDITAESGSDFDSGFVWFGYADFINSVESGDLGGIFDNVLITVTSSPGLVGDLNGDGFVGAGDLDILLGVWNQNVSGVAADLNEDGFIGAGDLDILLGNWNAGTPPAPAADVVPEPASLALLAAGGLAMLRRRRA